MKVTVVESLWIYIVFAMIALASCQSHAPEQVPTKVPSPNPIPEPTSIVVFHMAFAESDWDGKKIPDGQQCRSYGGQDPSTPPLIVSNIPEEANAIILEFSDRDYSPMDNGGHGIIGFTILEGTEEVLIPSVPSNTFDLPENFFLVREHKQNVLFTPGAYMPPCSGGRGNSYYVTAKAVEMISMDDLTFNILEESILELGRY